MPAIVRASIVLVLVCGGLTGCYCETRAGGYGYGTSGGAQPTAQPGAQGQPAPAPAEQGGVAGTPGGQQVGATAAGQAVAAQGGVPIQVATVSVSPASEPAAPPEPTDTVFGSTEPIPSGSLTGSIYHLEDSTRALPDFSTLTPVGNIYATRIDIEPRRFDAGFPGVTDRFEWFGVRYVGRVNFPTEGEYGFRVNADDGAKLYIDGNVVVDNDGVHPPRSQSGTVTLTPGEHEIVLEYFQGPRHHIALQLFMTPPGGEESIFSLQ